MSESATESDLTNSSESAFNLNLRSDHSSQPDLPGGLKTGKELRKQKLEQELRKEMQKMYERQIKEKDERIEALEKAAIENSKKLSEDLEKVATAAVEHSEKQHFYNFLQLGLAFIGIAIIIGVVLAFCCVFHRLSINDHREETTRYHEDINIWRNESVWERTKLQGDMRMYYNDVKTYHNARLEDRQKFYEDMLDCSNLNTAMKENEKQTQPITEQMLRQQTDIDTMSRKNKELSDAWESATAQLDATRLALEKERRNNRIAIYIGSPILFILMILVFIYRTQYLSNKWSAERTQPLVKQLL